MNNDPQLDLLIRKMAQEHQAHLPSPGLVWWRAQIQKKFAEKERVERPLMIMRTVAVIVCVGIMTGALLMNWRQIASVLDQGQTMALFTFAIAAGAVLLLAGLLLLRESMKKS
jgi:hypothetical protein